MKKRIVKKYKGFNKSNYKRRRHENDTSHGFYKRYIHNIIKEIIEEEIITNIAWSTSVFTEEEQQTNPIHNPYFDFAKIYPMDISFTFWNHRSDKTKTLDIEIDGKYHDDPKQKKKDKNRDEDMTVYGDYKVLRLSIENYIEMLPRDLIKENLKEELLKFVNGSN
jgi:hypothetical protein